jgi:hypothetical protein
VEPRKEEEEEDSYYLTSSYVTNNDTWLESDQYSINPYTLSDEQVCVPVTL